MFEQKLYKNGSSVVITVPKQLLKKHNLRDGSVVIVDSNSSGISFKPKKAPKGSRQDELTPEFKEWLDEINKEYGPALKKLAKL